jgi:hypothetical protein
VRKSHGPSGISRGAGRACCPCAGNDAQSVTLKTTAAPTNAAPSNLGRLMLSPR